MTLASADGQPWQAFAESISQALDDLELGANVYPAPTLSIAVPAIVIRADDPWLEGAAENEPMATRRENYAAIIVVNAAEPGDGMALLRQLALCVIGTEGNGWIWQSAGMPVSSEDQGITYLASTLRFTYSAED